MPLTPYTKALDAKKAAHLLRRCTFNVTPQRIRDFTGLTAEAAVNYLFNFDENSTNTPNELPPNPALLFPHGPIWHEDGAPIHPPNEGAGKVNHIGYRNYIYIIGCHDKVMYLKYDGEQVENLAYYEKLSENVESIDIYGQSVTIAKGTMVISHTVGAVEVTILRIWNSTTNQHDLIVYQNSAEAPNRNASLYTVYFVKPLNSYLTATYIQTYMFSWRMYEALQDTSVRWKLVFWMNSLFTTKIENQHYHYSHWKLMYDFVNGVDITDGFTNGTNSYANSLKAFAFMMTYSNEMLLYLDNNVNTKNGPNENYAREFLELFTILKDSNSNIEGNYVNYTEQDIVQAAKVLTGFKNDKTNFDATANRPLGKKVFAYHDISNKTFSTAFGGKTINGATNAADMDRELWDFINMVFDQNTSVPNTTNPNIQPTANAFVKKMYRYFVSDKIDDRVESNIISVLANDLYTTDSNQNVNFLYINVLKNLLKSEHFYEDGTSAGVSPCNSLIGSKIKSPLELLLTSINLFEISNAGLNDLVNKYKANFNQLNDKGYFNQDKTGKYIDVKFGTDRSCQIAGILGPFLDGGPDTAIPTGYTRIFYAVKGDAHDSLITRGNLTKGHIRNVFHNKMYTQFGVPLKLCGFNLEGPDTVEGYRGYYKEENYSKNWLDSSNFYNRYSFGRSLLDGYARFKGIHLQYENEAIQYKADTVAWVKRNIADINENIYSPDVVVKTLLKYLLPEAPISGSDRYHYFFQIFMRDIPNRDWAIAWDEFINDETDMSKRMEVETPLYNLCKAITESHEFQTF